MSEQTPAATESGPSIQWGDIALMVGVVVVVVGLMLTPLARRVWFPESVKPQPKGKAS